MNQFMFDLMINTSAETLVAAYNRVDAEYRDDAVVFSVAAELVRWTEQRTVFSCDFDWYSDYRATKAGNERRANEMREYARTLTTGYDRERGQRSRTQQKHVVEAVFYGLVCKDEELEEAYSRLHPA